MSRNEKKQCAPVSLVGGVGSFALKLAIEAAIGWVAAKLYQRWVGKKPSQEKDAE